MNAAAVDRSMVWPRSLLRKHELSALIRPNSGSGIRGQYLLDVQVVPTGSLNFPDLVATEVSVPATSQSGDEVAVSWTVKNVGHAATLVGTWKDQVFLSQDDISGNADDVFLAEFVHPGVLDIDATYNETQSVQLPDGISGSYRVFVRVDAGNAVNEYALEGNNITPSSGVLQIMLAPYPDLRVSSVAVPELVVGNPALIDIQWVVTNHGSGPGKTSSWIDHVIVSRNASYGDADDQAVAAFSHSGALDADGSYQRTEQVTLPAGLSGQYHVFVVTDAANQVYEYQGETNNFGEPVHVLAVAPSPFPDLVVSDVTVPAAGHSGSPLEVRWTVANQGPGATNVSFMAGSSHPFVRCRLRERGRRRPRKRVAQRCTGGERKLYPVGHGYIARRNRRRLSRFCQYGRDEFGQ